MASGLQWNEWEAPVTASENDLMVFIRSFDPIGYLLSKPVTTEPGTRFYYNGGTVNLLGVMLAFASEQSVQTFSSRYLFGPLGISNYHWQVFQPSGITFCSGDIYITPRDMAKFGQLFLDGGKWKGSRGDLQGVGGEIHAICRSIQWFPGRTGTATSGGSRTSG